MDKTITKICNINWSNHRYKVARKPQGNVFNTGNTGTDSSLSEMMGALYIDSPTACVWHCCLPEITNQILAEDNLNFDRTEECTTTEILPQCIPELVKEYGHALPSFTADQVAMIASADCPLCHQQRTGRTTGSTVHAVNVSAKNLRINNPVAKSILDTVLGLSKDLSSVAAFKYGKQNESVALHQYKSVTHSNGHVITVKKTGFMVSQRDIFVGACPDALLSYGWCGDGCLEIKCSLSITHTGPLTTPPHYLKKHSGKLSLSTNHQYYSQVS